MYEAYECSQLLKLSVPIECIAAYDNNLLVGTKVGHLLMYSISSRYSDNKNDVHLLRYNRAFSKKPIQQLAVVEEHQLLISLTDNIVCVHDIASINFVTICTVPETKGASLFSVDIKRTVTQSGKTSVIVRLCVAVKRKLLLFYWKNGSFHSLMEELTMPDTPKALAWIEETICVGFKGDSVYMLYHLNRDFKKDDWQQPLCPPGNRAPSVLGMNDENFILGKDNSSIFVKTNGEAASLKPMKWDSVPKDLVYDEPYIVALFPDSLEIRTVEPSLIVQLQKLKEPRTIIRCRSGLLYVASDEYVWCLQNVTWSRQIHFLLEQKQFQLALKIANISDEPSEDKAKNVHQIQTLYAYDLFNKKQFKESMEQFFKLETDPTDVVKLFPNLLPSQARTPLPEAVVKLDDMDLESGLLALIEYLTHVRHLKKAEKEKRDKEQAERDTKRKRGKLTIVEETNLEIESKKHEKFSKATEQLFQIIDTTLLKCYLQTNDAFVAPLIRLNHCHLGEAEKMLKKHGKNSELIILYQTKGLHKKALELLQKQSTHEDPSLQGHCRTVLYLQNLGRDHIELIFQFAGWVLEQHPAEGLSIFTEDMPEVESLPRPKVLDFLLRLHKNLVIPYLEHVIHVWKDESTILHDALVHQYREQVATLLNSDKAAEAKIVQAKLLAFLESSNSYSPENALIQFPYDSMFEERAVILGKLGKHEQVLSIYVMMLGNVNKAIKYCHEVYSSQRDGADEVYVLLIKMLISPPDSWLRGVPVSPATSKPDLETALSLLEENASKIRPIQALEVLPDTVPICRIRHFLETSLERQLNEIRRVLVLKSLTYAENLQVHEQRMHYESQSIMMTELNVCAVCKKRFGNQSAFVLYPDGDIVHFSCQDRKAEQ
ncbi:Vam6/Vps39-like protein [Frankliniella fusca]|uniref:Vam6/Vps39-like protein n=1 Tax=Frankliniella fusca TaxID=407009 RepID=A0AAE1I2K5_9NEOP|nr:Vam6/Vps39-like protein [Frankliniella fusca]